MDTAFQWVIAIELGIVALYYALAVIRGMLGTKPPP